MFCLLGAALIYYGMFSLTGLGNFGGDLQYEPGILIVGLLLAMITPDIGDGFTYDSAYILAPRWFCPQWLILT